MNTPKKTNEKRQTVRMSADTHKRFKLYCVEHDTSINDKINELIENFLNTIDKAKVLE